MWRFATVCGMYSNVLLGKTSLKSVSFLTESTKKEHCHENKNVLDLHGFQIGVQLEVGMILERSFNVIALFLTASVNSGPSNTFVCSWNFSPKSLENAYTGGQNAKRIFALSF